MQQSSTELLSKRSAVRTPAPTDVERVDAAIEPRGWVLPAVLSLSVGGHALILGLVALLPSPSFAIQPVTELDFVVMEPAPAPEVPAPPPVVEPAPEPPVQQARPAARPRREPVEPRPAPPPPAPILASTAAQPSTWAHPEGEAGGQLGGTPGGTGDTVGAAPVEAAPAPSVERDGISRAELRRRLLEYLRGTVRGYVNGRIEVPLVARREHLEGVVVVRMRLSRDGDILGVRLSRSSGHDILDQAAVASVERIGSVPAPPSSIPWDATQELPLDVRYEIR